MGVRNENCKPCVCVTITAYKPLLPQQSGRPASMQDCKSARLYESNWGVSWLALVMGLSAELLGKMCSLVKDNLLFSDENRSTSIHMNHRGLSIGVAQQY